MLQQTPGLKVLLDIEQESNLDKGEYNDEMNCITFVALLLCFSDRNLQERFTSLAPAVAFLERDSIQAMFLSLVLLHENFSGDGHLH